MKLFYTMSTSTMKRLHAAFSLALLTLAGAAVPASAADQIQPGPGAMRYGPSAATDLACKLGTAGNWLEANGAGVEWSGARRVNAMFGAPIATDTFRVAMNEAAVRALALVEYQTTDEVWHKVWEGQMPAPTPGFKPTCSEYRQPQKQMVKALRFTFRPTEEAIELNHAALLRR